VFPASSLPPAPSPLTPPQVLSPSTLAAYGDLVEKEVRIWCRLGRHPHVAALREIRAGPPGLAFVSGEAGWRGEGSEGGLPLVPPAAICPALALLSLPVLAMPPTCLSLMPVWGSPAA
jgi:hypothetical protein